MWLLVACADGEAISAVDADGDGWSREEGDCDDDDPGVHPGVEESCFQEDDPACDGAQHCGDREPDATVSDVWEDEYVEVPRLVDLADLDGDGAIDVLVEASDGGLAGAAVLLGSEARSGWPEDQILPIPCAFCTGSLPTTRQLADLDGDGTADVVSVGISCDYLYPGEVFGGGAWILSGAEVVAGRATDWCVHEGFVTGQEDEDAAIESAYGLSAEEGTPGLLAVGSMQPDQMAFFRFEDLSPSEPVPLSSAAGVLLGANSGVVLPDADGDGGADMVLRTDDAARLLPSEELVSLTETNGDLALEEVTTPIDARGRAWPAGIGDVDGDGLSDYAVESGSGDVVVYLGPSTEVARLVDIDWSPAGSAGDLDADGRDEAAFLVSDERGSDTPIVLGAILAAGGTLDWLLPHGLWQDTSRPHGGDVDGDGFDDLLLNKEGSLEVFFGPL